MNFARCYQVCSVGHTLGRLDKLKVLSEPNILHGMAIQGHSEAIDTLEAVEGKGLTCVVALGPPQYKSHPFSALHAKSNLGEMLSKPSMQSKSIINLVKQRHFNA